MKLAPNAMDLEILRQFREAIRDLFGANIRSNIMYYKLEFNKM